MAGLYRIEDEPRPGRLAHLAVSPFWPLLGTMLGGTWFGWGWFLLNGLAMGSATRKREAGLVAIGVLGSFAIVSTALSVASALPEREPSFVRWVILGLTLWKLGVSYFLYIAQQRSHALYVYFGGPSRNGFLPLFLAMVLFPKPLVYVPSQILRMVLR